MALLTISSVAAGALVLAGGAISGPSNLPDLIAEPTGAPKTQVYRDGRLLMRFDGFVTNDALAPAELEIYAANPNGQGVMQTVQQRVGGSPVAGPGGRTPSVVYEVADGHRHYHLKNAAEYTLWTPDEARQVALAQKTEAGFCLEDSQKWAGARSAAYSASFNGFCLQGPTPDPGPLTMGITPGWRDIYYAGLSYQWVDVSDVAPGRYRLANRADPSNVISETNEQNNGYAFRDAVVPGYMPRPLAVPRVDPGQPAAITLAADEYVSSCFQNNEDFSPDSDDKPYCDPGSIRYVITSLPQRGVLRQGGAVLTVGSVLSNGSITYTAAAGQQGADGFSYQVFDAGEPHFPRVRPEAAVSLQVGAPVTSVAISGAQPTIVAGLSMQLTAVVTNGPSGVTWTTTGGSVTATGLFTAPSGPGIVTVRATSKDDASAYAEATIEVTAPSAQAPAPIYAPPKLIKRFRVAHVGRRTVLVRLTAGPRKGIVRSAVALRGRVLARCKRPVAANRTTTCRLRLKRNHNLRKVRVTARFTAGRSTAVRRAYVIRGARR